MTRIYRRTDGGAVAVAEAAIAVFEEQRQLSDNAAESGGILLGRWILESEDVIVDDATRPSSGDRRGRFFFWRARKPAQKIVNKAWEESGATRWYLGDWHSHPEDSPTPSSRDRSDWLRILRAARFEQPALFFIIVGRKKIGLWEACKETGSITELAAEAAS